MITFYLNFFIFLIFISGILVFVSNRKHLLVTLISLEFIVLLIYTFMYIYINIFSFNLYFRIVFLTIRVCEGSLGLSILVSIIRTHGNDYFQSYNVLQC